jgi:hypothetical protein
MAAIEKIFFPQGPSEKACSAFEFNTWLGF